MQPITVPPGWQTTEFWMSAAAVIVGALLSSGLLGEGTLASQIAGAILASLAAFGYSNARGKVKAEVARGQAQMAMMRMSQAPNEFNAPRTHP